MKKIKIFKSTDKKYPSKLLKIKDYPKELYVLGNEKLLNKKSIAIVGSRDCTEYGAKYAESFAEQISKENICIVSGMALGIDTCAHIGALKEKGNTIAVLGCGFDHIYPEENTELFNKIIENNGCVISEYPPETEADLSKFPFRNRIISALSNGVLVVEAKHRSGSTVTARYAKEQEKKVFCIPGNIDLKTSVGTNRLIQGGAKLVTCVEDILIEYGFPVLTRMPTNINIIAKKCKLDISKVSQKLLMMEIKGYIKSRPGNEYVRL